MKQNIRKQIDYLLKITDKIGIVEHCCFDKPNYVEGYCVDDNARAVQVCLGFQNEYPILKKVLPTYFGFIKSAIKKDKLYNDLNSDLSWKNDFIINGEHYGRTLAALGEINNLESSRLFEQIYSFFTEKKSPYIRVTSQIIWGLKNYRPEDIKIWADAMVLQYMKEKTNNWKWFESLISYDSGRLPMALLAAYQTTKNEQYLEIALESLDFLTNLIFDKEKDCFVFPGNVGWLTKNNSRAIFDQQPIEAGSATEVYSLAFLIVKNKKYKDLALKSFGWYSGKNILKVNMIDEKTGGIYDGFSEKKVNKNQGAESILSYLLANNALAKIS